MKHKSKNTKPATIGDIPVLLSGYTKTIGAYKGFIFFLVVASFYGFIVWRINTFSNAPASTSEISTQTTKQPRIDTDTIAKIKSLQDNSVSVQSLFVSARDNPFQE